MSEMKTSYLKTNNIPSVILPVHIFHWKADFQLDIELKYVFASITEDHTQAKYVLSYKTKTLNVSKYTRSVLKK